MLLEHKLIPCKVLLMPNVNATCLRYSDWPRVTPSFFLNLKCDKNKDDILNATLILHYLCIDQENVKHKQGRRHLKRLKCWYNGSNRLDPPPAHFKIIETNFEFQTWQKI